MENLLQLNEERVKRYCLELRHGMNLVPMIRNASHDRYILDVLERLSWSRFELKLYRGKISGAVSL